MRSVTRAARAIAVAALCGLGPLIHPAAGQVTHGVITGTVTDSTGAAVAGVGITARRLDTNQIWQAATNDQGLYRMADLPPARYQVRVEAQGFTTAEFNDVALTVAETRRLDVVLVLGDRAETVDVTFTLPLVDTEQGSLSGVVRERQIVDLPLNGRNVYQLTLTQAGTASMENSGLQTTSPAVNGQRPRGNNFLLDGITNNFEFLTGEPVITPTVDSVQEFRIVTNNFSAEYGRNAGSVVNVVTKSGGNQRRGSAWAFHRNSALDAREFFDAKKLPFRQNQFGGTFGAPIQRDRTFLFASYEGFRSVFGRSQVVTVETPELRAFTLANAPNSVAAFLYRTFPAPMPTSNLRDVGTPRPGLRVQSATNDPSVGSNPSYRPLGNGLYENAAQLALDGVPDVGDAIVTINDRIRSDQGSLRLDQDFGNGRDRLYGRYYLTDFNQPKLTPSLRGGFDTSLQRRLQNFGAVYTHIFSPNVVNELRFGFVRDKEFWQASNPGVPYLLVESPAIEPFGADVTWPRLVVTNTFQYLNVLSWSRGRHGLKAGAEVRRVQEDGNWFLNRGQYAFFDPLDFAQDEPFFLFAGIDPGKLRLATNPVQLRNSEMAAFAQDDWKVTPSLTLNLGVRYEIFGRVAERNNRLGNVVLPAGGDLFDDIGTATAAAIGPVAQPDRNNIAPRLGFAWDPFRDGRMSVRGGFGVSYNKVFNNAIGVARLNPPYFSYSIVQPVFTAGQAGAPIIYGPSNGAPVTIEGDPTNIGTDAQSGVRGNIVGYNPAHGFGRQNLRAIDPRLRDPYARNWFVGVQRTLGRQVVLDVNYAGSVGRLLEMRVDPNTARGDLLDGQLDRPNPRFSSVRTLTNLGSSSYHALQVQVNRRLGNGVQFQGAYTFSRTMDNSSDIWGPMNEGESLDVPMDARALAQERGRSTLDVPHRFVVNALWELPFFADRRGAIASVLGGWQANVIGQLQSGLPFTVYSSASYPNGDFNADGNANDRPNAPTTALRQGRSTGDYVNGLFTAADFPRPAPGTNGMLPRNAFRGPGFASVDLALMKHLSLRPLAERAKLQVRVEAFNLLNRVNLRQARGDLASPLFGRSVGTLNARQIQLAAKLLW